jgi:hypothetical protein
VDVDDLRHIGVNALSHGSLFDDQVPYDSLARRTPREYARTLERYLNPQKLAS